MTVSTFGTWWDPADPDEKIAGELTLRPLRTPWLSLLDAPQALWHRSPHASGTMVPLLHGRLSGQGAVTLLHSVWGGMQLAQSTHTEKLLVDVALMGIWLDAPDEPCIRRLEVRWPALQALSGRHMVWVRRPPPLDAEEIGFGLNPARRTWDDGDVSVTFQNDLRYSTSALSADVRLHPTVILTSDVGRSYDWWRSEWLVPLNNLLTIATGCQANPLSIDCWQTKEPDKKEHLARRVEVFSRGIGEQPDSGPRRDVSLITAEDLDRNEGGIHDVVACLRQLEEQQAVFLELLMDVANYPDRPLRNRYLDVVSSLEAYHTQVHGIGPVDDVAYKAERKAVITAAKEAGLSSAEVKFLKDWLSGHSFFSLEKRLRALEKRLTPQEDRKVSARRLAELRNHVAHGNTADIESELQEAYDEAFELARRTVLHDLGL